MADGYLHDSLSDFLDEPKGNLVLTFNNLIKRTDLVKILGEMLVRLEKAWGQPVDIEFTAHADSKGSLSVNLLQCRALQLPRASGAEVKIPENLPRERILFRSSRAISAGVISNIRYIIYIEPRKYAEATPIDTKKALGRVVGKINELLLDRGSKVMAMGPGRWGSNNLELGVNVSYADIDKMAVLVEMAYEGAGHEPEVSYGTHFFQDLVEAEVIYLPVYPDNETTDFNNRFFEESPNILSDLLPDLAGFQDVVHIIDVPSVTKGAHAQVIADPHTRSAVCFLE
jgi:hypothetical protein